MFGLLKLKLNSLPQLLSNTSWLLSTEIIAKLSRIFTIIVLAAELSPTNYGTAMLALAMHDVFGLLLRAGVGSQIINCEGNKLKTYCKNGIIIQWAICIIIVVVQLGSADLLASLYENQEISFLLQVMVIIYVFYPWVCIRIFLLQRENQMRWYSIRSSACIIIENTTVAITALMGADILSVALGKIAFSIFWFVFFSFSPVKSYGHEFQSSVIWSMIKTSSKLFNSELLKTSKIHMDTFVAGKLLSPELFGFYTFAKNAGVGLSQSISQVYISALYPYLCKIQREGTLQHLQRKVLLMSLAFSLIFVAQALIVPVYVPILFGEKWMSATFIISLLCFMALPNFIVDIFCCIARVKQHYHKESISRLLCLIITLVSLAFTLPDSPLDFAIVMLLSSTCCALIIYFNNLKNHTTSMLLKQSAGE